MGINYNNETPLVGLIDYVSCTTYPIVKSLSVLSVMIHPFVEINVIFRILVGNVYN